MTTRRKNQPPAPPPPPSAQQLADNELLAASNALQSAYEYAKDVEAAADRLRRAALAYAAAQQGKKAHE